MQTPQVQPLPLFPDDVLKLEKMQRGARKDARRPRVYLLARKLVQNLPSDAYERRASLIHDWVRDCIKYEHDPDRIERLETSLELLAEAAGDCDGKVRLAVALARGLGYNARVIPVWAPRGRYRRLVHVQWGMRYPLSERSKRPFKDGPWVKGDLTIKGAGFGEDPMRIQRNPETGRLPLQ